MRRVLACLLMLLLLACGKEQPFQLTDITGIGFARDFHLQDSQGHPRSLADYRGKVVWLFFGYTHCPDVCPTTMVQLAAARKQMGADGQSVQVLFVTLDPERDTPAVLSQYVPAFDHSFIGLSATPAVIASTASEFKVVYQKNVGSDPNNYTLDHTAAVFVFDPQGRPRLYYTMAQGIAALASDSQRLLKE